MIKWVVVMPMKIERLSALGKTFLRGDWLSSAAHQDHRASIVNIPKRYSHHDVR